MTDIYLNQELKAKYMADFENVLKVTNESWKLSEKIRQYLIKINENPKIQTLYSKFPEGKHELDHNESYLKFAYSKDIELKLFREFLPVFVGKYNQLKNSTFNYMFREPHINPNYDGEKSEIDIACLNDPDYNMVNNIRLVLKCSSKNIHDEFWEFVTGKLSEIK
ncbi:MAG: hypothetical protein RBR97_09020 [Bacteroidales bacterium]|nr:hypothetical protein [Bacteroidales bacterium]